MLFPLSQMPSPNPLLGKLLLLLQGPGKGDLLHEALPDSQQKQPADPCSVLLWNLTQGSPHCILKFRGLSPQLAVDNCLLGRDPILLYLKPTAPKVTLAQSRCPAHNIVTHLLSLYYVPGPELDALSKLSHFFLKITLQETRDRDSERPNRCFCSHSLRTAASGTDLPSPTLGSPLGTGLTSLPRCGLQRTS